MIGCNSNGKIISFGGRENGFVSCAYADIYDPSTNSFSEMPMNFTHDFAAVAKLSDGRYFIAGGGQDWGVPAILLLKYMIILLIHLVLKHL
jgi:hypothetical protein